MKKELTRILSAAAALSLLTACGGADNDRNDKDSSSNVTTTTAVKITSATQTSADEDPSSLSSSADSQEMQMIEIKGDGIDDIPADADGTLDFLSYYDLNPTNLASEKRADVALFEKHGGTILHSQTTSSERYDTLARRLLSGDIPDMFSYEQYMTFPANCLKGMFQPVDSIVDFSEPMWTDVKDTADFFMLNGEHYVAPIGFTASTILTYDQDVIEENGLYDPYELYQAGEWDWNAWYDIMDKYVKAADGEERYGVNGWFAPFIFRSTGHTLIEYDEKTDSYVSNINDENIKRAADLLCNISKNGLYYPDWTGNASGAFRQNVLFYAMGSWASSNKCTPENGENWRSVPIPRDPESDTEYAFCDVTSYMWVKGSQKNDAMKCWLECARFVKYDPDYLEIEKAGFLADNPNWNDEMYKVACELNPSNGVPTVFDPGWGLTTTLSDNDLSQNQTMEAVVDYMYSSVLRTDDNGDQYTWDRLCEEYSEVIDDELALFNNSYENFGA